MTLYLSFDLPRKMINPGRMSNVQLTSHRARPFRQSLVVLLCRGNMPAHYEEHDVQDCDLLGYVAYAGEFA